MKCIDILAPADFGRRRGGREAQRSARAARRPQRRCPRRSPSAYSGSFTRRASSVEFKPPSDEVSRAGQSIPRPGLFQARSDSLRAVRTLRSIFPCSGFVLWLALSSAASAQTAEELEEARATFAEGVELSRAGRWAAAAQRFRRVHAVRATPAVKFNLGLALVRSGREQQGERYLRAALNSGELDGESSARARRELNRISSSSRSASSAS